MGSESDRKTGKSTNARRQGRVVEDERGRQIWQDTIKHIKLSLMDTGVFCMSKVQERLSRLRESDAIDELDENRDSIDDNDGFDPYDSAEK